MADESTIPVPAYVLGQALERARSQAGVTLEAAGEAIGRTTTSVRRFETGKVVIDKLQLERLITLYNVDAAGEAELINLYDAASRKEWWTQFGARPQATALMLGMETTAGAMWSWDPCWIPGLLQSPAYARSVIREVDLDSTPKKLQIDVDLRMARQAKVWEENRAPQSIFLIDEGALLRITGSVQSRRGQLVKLLALPPTATLQIVPFSAGPHPALGSFKIFDFDSPTTPQAVYAEGSIAAKDSVEFGEPVNRYKLVFERMRAKAFDQDQSARYIEKMMEGIRDE